MDRNARMYILDIYQMRSSAGQLCGWRRRRRNEKRNSDFFVRRWSRKKNVNVSDGFSKAVRMAWVEGVGEGGWAEDKEASKEVKEAVDITEINKYASDDLQNWGCLMSVTRTPHT